MEKNEMNTEVSSVAKAAAAYAFGIPVQAINHGSTRVACDARRALSWFLKDVIGIGWGQQAPLLLRDASTLRHHYKKHTHFYDTDASYRESVRVMIEQLTQKKDD